VPVPPTPEEWGRLPLPIPPTADEQEWMEIPVDQ